MGFKIVIDITSKNEIVIKFLGDIKSPDAFELSVSGIFGVIPGVNPPAPPLPMNGVVVGVVVVVGITGELGLFAPVVGVVPPALLVESHNSSCLVLIRQDKMHIPIHNIDNL